MFQQGIKGVDFVITNTDAQALSESECLKVQLGATLTEGLGGANHIGAMAAKESEDQIKSILSTQTKMIFITAGMVWNKTVLTSNSSDSKRNGYSYCRYSYDAFSL